MSALAMAAFSESCLHFRRSVCAIELNIPRILYSCTDDVQFKICCTQAFADAYGFLYGRSVQINVLFFRKLNQLNDKRGHGHQCCRPQSFYRFPLHGWKAGTDANKTSTQFVNTLIVSNACHELPVEGKHKLIEIV